MQVVHACLNCKGSHAGLYCSILSAQALCVLQAAADSGPVPKREVGQITGTNSDLRRLSMEKSREILISLGITDDEIKGASCNGVRGSETTPSVSGLPVHVCPDGRDECQTLFAAGTKAWRLPTTNIRRGQS